MTKHALLCHGKRPVIGCHRRNRPMGRVPSNFGDHGDQLYLVPSNFCNWLLFFAGHCGKCTVLSQTLLNSAGEGTKSRAGNAWNMGEAISGRYLASQDRAVERAVRGVSYPRPRGNVGAPWSLKMNFFVATLDEAEADNSNFIFSTVRRFVDNRAVILSLPLRCTCSLLTLFWRNEWSR